MNDPRGPGMDADPDLAWVTVAEAATVMRVSKMTVYRLIHGGDLRAARIGRSLRIARSDLERYLRDAHAKPTGTTDDDG